MPVPVDVQLALFSKILTFERNLTASDKEVLTMGILYQKRFRTSLNVKDACMAATAPSKQRERFRFHCIPIDISDHTELASAVSERDVDVLYVAPLRAVDIARIAEIGRAQQITTFTGVPDYVVSGLAVGIGTKGRKPRIIVNLPVAKAAGADFHAQLLKLSKVIH